MGNTKLLSNLCLVLKTKCWRNTVGQAASAEGLNRWHFRPWLIWRWIWTQNIIRPLPLRTLTDLLNMVFCSKVQHLQSLVLVLLLPSSNNPSSVLTLHVVCVQSACTPQSHIAWVLQPFPLFQRPYRLVNDPVHGWGGVDEHMEGIYCME